MVSKNKKKKAHNSFIHNGGEKNTVEQWKCRRIAYFTKNDRKLLNRRCRMQTEFETEDGTGR